MRSRVGLLGALLGVQLVAIALFLFVEADAGGDRQATLLAFAPPAVEELRLGAPELDEPLVIRSGDAGWVLPSGLPADGAKVEQVIEQLAGLRAAWPVATSASARERFEVTGDNHQRHVQLVAGGAAVAELYLGTSPGYQRVHARRADDDAVFSVELSNYQLPTEADEWLDKTLLQARGDIVSVTRAGAWRLHRDGEDGAWQVDDAPADPEAAAELVRRLRELRVTGTAAAPAEGAEPVAEFLIGDAEGEYAVRVYSAEDGNAYTLASTRRDAAYFGLAAYSADRLLVDRAALLPGSSDSGAGPGAAATD